MPRIRTLIAMILLCIGSTAAYAEEEPMTVGEAMSRCLASYNWSSWNIWRFDVYASAQDKVLVGSLENYYRFTSARQGYEHLIDGKVAEENRSIRRISELTHTCTDNCPQNIRKRLKWFKRRCKAFD